MDSEDQLHLPLLPHIDLLSSKHDTIAKKLFGNVKVHAAAATVQILYAGFQVLACAAISSGTSRSIFPVYRNAIAALLIAPFAFFLERQTRPRMTFYKLSQLFISGLIGICINQTLFLSGLYYTSATFTATLQNLTPALTFAIAASLGIEKVQIKRREGQAKALGVLFGIGGATLIALYKGPAILSIPGSFFENKAEADNSLEISSFISWQLGVLCLLGNCVTWAIWFIIQVLLLPAKCMLASVIDSSIVHPYTGVMQSPLLRDYPAQLTATSFTYLFGSIQLALVAVYTERNIDVWTATLYSDLPAILYGGLVASGLAMTLQGWCAYRGGPVLVAAYQPLQTILVALLSSIFLQETFYMGSLVGGLFITTGLYLVVWGKSRERRVAVLAENLKDLSRCRQNIDYSVETAENLRGLLVDGGRNCRSSNAHF